MNDILLAIQIASVIIAANVFICLVKRQRTQAGSALLVMMSIIFLYNVLGIFGCYHTGSVSVYVRDVIYYVLEAALWVCIVVVVREILGLKLNRNYILYPALVYGIIVLIRLTDLWTGWFYRAVWYQIIEQRPVMRIQPGVGAVACVMLNFFIAAALFVNALVENVKCKKSASKVKKQRLRVALLATMMPFFNYFLMMTGIFWGRESAVMTMLIQGLLLFHAVLSYGVKSVVRQANNLILENMDLGIIIVDKNYCYLDANRFAKVLYPVLDELQREDAIHEKAPDIYELFKSEERKRVQIEDGYYECQIFQVQLDDKTKGLVVGIYDVTEQTRYQNELVKHRQKAEELSRRKSVLLANASHEIRTPMNVILGMSELCLRKNKDPELSYELRSIYNSGQGLLEVVEGILDLSKSELENQKAEETLYSLERVLMEVFNLIHARMLQSQVGFKMELETSVPKWVHGDSGKVRAILVNVLGNAEKYTREGSISIRVAAKEQDENVRIDFTVVDTGIGMSSEDSVRVFDSFVRSKDAEERDYMGTGLGLAITRDMIELLSGEVRVESELGKGSTFYITIYQKKADSPYMNPGIITADKVMEYLFKNNVAAEVMPNYQSVRALVVDDLEVNTLVARGILELYGIQVTISTSGKEVLEIVKYQEFDLFFIDLRQPEMSGEEILRRLRELDKYKNTPMIALTASNDLETMSDAKKAGFDEFMTKPIEKPVLEQILKRYFPNEALKENVGVFGWSESEEDREMVRNRDRRRILSSYFLQVSKMKEALKQQAENDLSDFVISVHGIKGASRSIGAVEMANWAEQMEMAGREERMEDIRCMLPGFLDILSNTLSQVSEELKMLEQKQAEVQGMRKKSQLKKEVLQKLMLALERFELDEAEEILDILAQKRYNPREQQLLMELQNDVAELDYDIGIEKIQEFLEK